MQAHVTYRQGKHMILRGHLPMRALCCVKNDLDVAGMHPIRRWKALMSYFTIPISLK